jgi:biotin-(acetyl-CoA carboxylase) ligase
MSVGGGSHSITVAVVGIGIDWNVDVTEVDTEQAGCIIMEVVIVLDF